MDTHRKEKSRPELVAPPGLEPGYTAYDTAALPIELWSVKADNRVTSGYTPKS